MKDVFSEVYDGHLWQIEEPVGDGAHLNTSPIEELHEHFLENPGDWGN